MILYYSIVNTYLIHCFNLNSLILILFNTILCQNSNKLKQANVKRIFEVVWSFL